MQHEPDFYYELEVYPSKKKPYYRWHVLKRYSNGDVEAELGSFDYFDTADDAQDNAWLWLSNAFDFGETTFR